MGMPSSTLGMLCLAPLMTIASQSCQENLATPQGPDRIAIVAPVGKQPLRPVARTPGAMGARDVDRGQGSIQQGYLRRGCRRHVKSERSTRAINQYHKLCSLAALSLADFGPPFLAGTKVPS